MFSQPVLPGKGWTAEASGQCGTLVRKCGYLKLLDAEKGGRGGYGRGEEALCSLVPETFLLGEGP